MRRSGPMSLLAAAVPLVTAAATLLGAPTAQAVTHPAAANAGPGFPAHFAAPYAETWNSPSTLGQGASASGNKYYTLAFVIAGSGCQPTFNGDTPVSDSGWVSAINSLRASGGDVIASFGGASGTELAQACGSVSSLEAAYKTVVDTLNLTRIDLDVEGGALDDTAANDRRNQALAALQQSYAAAGKSLAVDYTLPVDPSGLEGDSLSLLNNAKSHNLNVSLVNIMTMDYGPDEEMGQAAISAAQGLHGQLGQIWTSKTSAQLWAMEGNTPMIGVNDAQNEVFTTADATSLESFAASNGIQELSFWALGRDHSCGSGQDSEDNCSGVSQSAYQFTKTFAKITGGTGTGTGGGGATGRITGYGGKCADVAGGASANGTAVDLYTCNGSSAQSWTVGSDGTLKALGKCMDATSAGTANGTKVQLYDCNGTGSQVWQAGANGSLVNPQSGRCLDATGPSSADGTRLQLWDCAGSANQNWQLPA